MNDKVKNAKNKILEIKANREAKQSKLFEDVKLFWAFSDKQFEEGMKNNNLDQTTKMIHIGGGGYMPKINFDIFEEGMKKQEIEYKKEMKNYKNDLIKYELNNYEAYYTGDINEVVDLLKGFATYKQILKVYNENIEFYA